MGFINRLELIEIDTVPAMSAALQCAIRSLTDSCDVDVTPERTDPADPPGTGACIAHFVIEPQTGDSDFRVTVSNAAQPRPVQLGESMRRVVGLAGKVGVNRAAKALEEAGQLGDLIGQVGVDRAIEVLEGLPTDSEKFLIRTIRASGLGEQEAVARLFPTAIGGDDGAINRLLARLIAVGGKFNAIDALAASIRGFVESSERISDDDADAILAEVSAIEAEARERRDAEAAGPDDDQGDNQADDQAEADPLAGPLTDDQRAVLRAFWRLDLNPGEAIARMTVPYGDRGERERTLAEAMALVDRA